MQPREHHLDPRLDAPPVAGLELLAELLEPRDQWLVVASLQLVRYALVLAQQPLLSPSPSAAASASLTGRKLRSAGRCRPQAGLAPRHTVVGGAVRR
jgi:hypothetical protein